MLLLEFQLAACSIPLGGQLLSLRYGPQMADSLGLAQEFLLHHDYLDAWAPLIWLVYSTLANLIPAVYALWLILGLLKRLAIISSFGAIQPGLKKCLLHFLCLIPG